MIGYNLYVVSCVFATIGLALIVGVVFFSE